MGNANSGRWASHRKATTVEDVSVTLCLDSQLAAAIRQGGAYHVRWQWWPDWPQPQQESALVLQVVEDGQAVILQYQASNSGREVDERVPIVTARLTYGQRRFWLCPGCDRRAAILYYLGRFRCRHCHGLTYRSAQEADGRVYALARGIDHPAALDLRLRLKAHELVLRRRLRDLRRPGG